MAMTLPITRDIVVSESRSYYIDYAFCDLGVVPSDGNIIAKAFPRFAHDALFIGILTNYSTYAVTRFFSPGDKLYRRTGNSQKGRMSLYAPEQDYPVAYPVEDSQAIDLFHYIENGVLRVVIPFGVTFSRYVSTTGYMSTDDMYLPNSPMKYAYAVMSGADQIGGGTIDITIDLGKDPNNKKDEQPTVCSVKVT